MAVYRKEKAGQKREDKKKSRKRKDSNMWTFPGRFIAVLCILLLVLWRSESPIGRSQQPQVICLTEGKNVRLMNQGTGLESPRDRLRSVQSESSERDESSQGESGEKGDGDKKNTLSEHHVQTVDDQQIWINDTDVEIFKTVDQNMAGETTVQSSNSDKVIAPGTSGTYIFFLQNTGAMKVDYKVSLKAGLELEGIESPLEIRMADDNGWLAPCRSGWQSISNLSRITETGQLLPNQKGKYILYWRWTYQRGKDEEDTSLGNDTEDTLHTIVIHTEAVQSISENTGDTDSGMENAANMGQTKAEDRHTQSADVVKTADMMSPGIWLMVLIFAGLVLAACLTVIWLRKRRGYNLALLSFVLLLVAVPTDIYAKYIFLAVKDSSLKVAGFEHAVSICPEGELPELWTPGSQAVYSIQVSNQSTRGTSQTGQTYSIEVVTAGALPLRCTLFEESQWEGNWNELEAFTESPQEKTHIFQTSKMQLPGEVPTEHTYRLVVSWEEDDDLQITGTEDFIKINVNLEQRD